MSRDFYVKRHHTGVNETEDKRVKNTVQTSSQKDQIGTCQQVIESEIYFAPPEKDRALEVINIEKKLELLNVEVVENSVFVNGLIHKGIMYKTIKVHDEKNKKEENKEDKETKKNQENQENKDNKDNKEEKKNKEKKEKEKPTIKTKELIPVAVDGVVRHTTTWIPFRCYVPIEGAQPGDAHEVLSAELLNNDSVAKNINYEEVDASVATESTNNENDPQYIQGVMDSDILKFVVKIIKS
ncbi:MAG: DUF3794 domain-containing protein [Clostridiaceae bacterium]|nr:DUF3794 domain-containing protein [Clostridiaceae bacterium]